jgi:hypothetical protein
VLVVTLVTAGGVNASASNGGGVGVSGAASGGAGVSGAATRKIRIAWDTATRVPQRYSPSPAPTPAPTP